MSAKSAPMDSKIVSGSEPSCVAGSSRPIHLMKTSEYSSLALVRSFSAVLILSAASRSEIPRSD